MTSTREKKVSIADFRPGAVVEFKGVKRRDRCFEARVQSLTVTEARKIVVNVERCTPQKLKLETIDIACATRVLTQGTGAPVFEKQHTLRFQCLQGEVIAAAMPTMARRRWCAGGTTVW